MQCVIQTLNKLENIQKWLSNLLQFDLQSVSHRPEPVQPFENRKKNKIQVSQLLSNSRTTYVCVFFSFATGSTSFLRPLTSLSLFFYLLTPFSLPSIRSCFLHLMAAYQRFKSFVSLSLCNNNNTIFDLQSLLNSFTSL